MKRLLCLLLVLTAVLSLCACQGNFGSINLKDPVNIPENGEIDKSTIMQIKNENAIAVFVGTSGDFKYEWTVFAGTIRDAKTVNLGVQLSKTDDGSICVVLNQAETFGFSASLAIHLNERWSAQNATARAGENAFATVSLTGSKHTILNVNLDGTVAEFVIQPESFVEEQTPTQNTQPPAPENTTDSTTAPTKPEEETTPATQPTEPETQPQETQPEETQPEPTEPEETQPEPTQPEETQPETTQPVSYKITKGDGATWHKDSGKDLSFTADGDHKDFQKLLVDGKIVNSKYYTVTKGTAVTLQARFLQSLDQQKHTITLVFADGEAEGTFRVSAPADESNPKTGDGIHLWMALLFVSLTGMAGIGFVCRKRSLPDSSVCSHKNE